MYSQCVTARGIYGAGLFHPRRIALDDPDLSLSSPVLPGLAPMKARGPQGSESPSVVLDMLQVPYRDMFRSSPEAIVLLTLKGVPQSRIRGPLNSSATGKRRSARFRFPDCVPRVLQERSQGAVDPSQEAESVRWNWISSERTDAGLPRHSRLIHRSVPGALFLRISPASSAGSGRYRNDRIVFPPSLSVLRTRRSSPSARKAGPCKPCLSQGVPVATLARRHALRDFLGKENAATGPGPFRLGPARCGISGRGS